MSNQIFNRNDTIVAISTPLGRSGLGIVRLSGPDSLKIAECIFIPKNRAKKISEFKSFTVHLGYIVEGNEIIDEVLLTIMRAPKSYTCEDVVEFSCHGGPIILKKVLQLCIKNGARLAEPGEFTKRAFLNGRLSLSQAESICDLINSTSELQAKLFTNSLLGKNKEEIENIIEKIKATIAELEVTIEYPEEDDSIAVDFEEIKNKIQSLTNNLQLSIENTEKILPIITGVNVAIIGKVNVGKSSLLNILLNIDRAIVSEIPGTTRDIISETINLKGVPIKIVDTAGIREHSQDPIEKIGIERTRKAIEEADVILLLFDASKSLHLDDFKVVDIILNSSEEYNGKILIPIINKIDLESKILNDDRLYEILLRIQEKIKIYPKLNKDNWKNNILKISCVSKQGIEQLEQAILNSQCIFNTSQNLQDTIPTLFVTNLRQKELLEKAYHELSEALKLDIKESCELVCEHLKNAAKELSKITGGEITEDILNNIFSKFCVGK